MFKKTLILIATILLVNCGSYEEKVDAYNEEFLANFNFDEAYEKGCWIDRDFFDIKYLLQNTKPKKDISNYTNTLDAVDKAYLYYETCLDSDWESFIEPYSDSKIDQKVFLECDTRKNYKSFGPLYLFITIFDEPDKNRGSFVTLSFDIDENKQLKNYNKKVTKHDKNYDVTVNLSWRSDTWEDEDNKMMHTRSKCIKDSSGRESCLDRFQYLDRETLTYGTGTRPSGFKSVKGPHSQSQCKIAEGFSKDFNPYPQLSLIRKKEKERRLKEKQEQLTLEEENRKKRLL